MNEPDDSSRSIVLAGPVVNARTARRVRRDSIRATRSSRPPIRARVIAISDFVPSSSFSAECKAAVARSSSARTSAYSALAASS